MAAGGFVSRAFETMLKESGGKKFPDLQKAIQAYQDGSKVVTQAASSSIDERSQAEGEGAKTGGEADEPQKASGEVAEQASQSKSGTINISLANAGHTLGGAEVELVLKPLRLAFETKNLKIFDAALDCLHKLIAYDHLEGDPGLDGGKNSAPFTDILNMVCGCIDNSSPDSKSPINQATSKAMLTQMISIVFRRMETDIVSSSSSVSQEEHVSGDSSSLKTEEIIAADQSEKEMTLGDALTQAKDTTLASVEELHTLVGGADIKGLEAALDKAVHLEDGKKIKRGIELESMSIGQRDALLVFRTLCKMGMKEDSDEVTTKTRILSLELLQGMLEGVSHSFTKNFHFIDSVKAYLSYALLRASVSQSSVIFQGEIGIFFPIIVLRSLDSSECPNDQKMGVLRMLEKVCKDPQMLVDVYVNYDCDLEAPNLFERMVTTLSKIAQGTQSADPNPAMASQTASVKGSSLQCLVNVLKSLVDWEKIRREAENSTRHASEDSDSAGEPIETKSREDGPSNFEKAKAHKSTMEAAISEFNRNAVKGIEYLIANKLVERNPASVAQFLRSTSSLKKVMIGDYLGQHEEFPLAVMHAYVDSMKFSEMKFHTAIREFLKGFRLPGEAQKIDRIMEKFAERYCADNPGLFKNADTAYVLAYAVIMLNTDAHNPMVWPKMSKSDFIRMNATTDPEDCAPTELLEEIYDSIVKEEIKLKDDDSSIRKINSQRPGGEGGLVSILNLGLPKRISAADAKSETEDIVRKTQEIFRKDGVKRGVFHTVEQVDIIRPMVEAVGWPLLAAFSVTMEVGDNKPRILLCMEGFKAGIHIAFVLGMDTMRYAFLTSLVRFTFLHAPKEMRSKNVEALRILLALCDSEPDTLQDTWNAVLECVSRLEFIVSTPGITATVMHGSNQISRDGVVQSLKELAGRPAEQVFVNSVKLPSESVVEFFTALCGVSAEELKQSPARVFSLQKLVEISYYNIARIRMVWARIWSVLAEHFVSAGSHHDEKIAMYAIDSLRQLGMKYLERAELTNFTFQNDILKPFVIIMRNTQSQTIRSLIVDCIVQMIKSKVGSIKSGWRSVFMIFTAAADDDVESIVEKSFENVEQVILEHFDQVIGDCFMDCVNCLIRFANNKASDRISLKAIALLRICEDRLAEGLIPGGVLKPVNTNEDETFDVTEHYWYPMLAGLSDLTSDFRPEVRNCALEVLFDLLNERGKKFSTPFWESIFHRILFPIFDHVSHAGKEGLISSGDVQFRETSIHSLQLLCNLFNTFYKEVCFMLPPLLSLLLDCAKKSDQTVVSISLGALVHLIEVGGHQFSEGDWDMLLKSIRDASYTTQPLELLNALGLDNPNKNLVVTGDIEAVTTDSPRVNHSPDDNGKGSAQSSPRVGIHGASQESGIQPKDDVSEGRPSSTGRSQKEGDDPNIQRSQTFGQRFMDNLFLRNLTSQPKSSAAEVSVPSSPHKQVDPAEPDNREEESPALGTIRGKCITQLLLLGAINSIQKKYWSNLKTAQKIAIMDILFSFIEFAASYNSYSNLRTRMNHIPAERPPLNLLRQELEGTTIYMDVLHKTTSGLGDAAPETEDKLEDAAEEKLVSFCEQVLKETSDLQSSLGESTNMDVHRVLELRSPVIVKVLEGMCFMNNKIFREHMREFYPLLTRLVCCEQASST
ncbi:hypothetical protein Bca4012_037088 [Brassica carinata]